MRLVSERGFRAETPRTIRPQRLRSYRLSPRGGSTVKLTVAIALVALVLVAGTTTICLSGAVTDCTTEYGGAHAAIDSLFNPHPKACQ
jgi:hypothetical protein